MSPMKAAVPGVGTAFLMMSCALASAAGLDGQWSGSLQCGASIQNPAKAPAFTSPVTMGVTGQKVRLERDTAAASEVYTGVLRGKGQQITLNGDGHYKDTSRSAIWTAKIEGQFTSDQFTGTGQIVNQNGEKVRDCTAQLAKVEVPVQVAQKREPPIVSPQIQTQTGVPAMPSQKQLGAIAAAPQNTKSGLVTTPSNSPGITTPVPLTAAPEPRPIAAAETTKTGPLEPVVQPAQSATTEFPTVPPERTLTGTMKWGTTDSCLDVPVGQSSRCYGFPATGAVADSLVKVCNQNDTCTVTGQFDDEKAVIAAVSKALAVPAIASPVVEAKPVPAAPVASASPAQPSDKQTAASGFAAIGLGGVVVLALGGAVLIFRRRPNSPKPVPMPAVAPVVQQGLTLDVDLPSPHLSKTEGMGKTGVASLGSVPQAIWNPNATVWWSLLLSPALGSYLQMRNWQALGEQQKAAQAKTWFYISLVMIAALLTLSEVFGHIPAVRSATGSLPLVYFITWYLQDGRFQGKHVKAKFGTSYPKRPWARVLLIAGAAYLSVIAAVVLMEERSTGPSDTPVRVSRESTNGGSAVASSTACAGGDVMAKFPAAWKDAYILADVNSPEEFPKFICGMGDRGAQVHYLSGGLFSSEGFEVVSKARTVQVYLEAQRVPGADPKTPFLVPVKAKIDGNKITISRENYRAFQAELIAAALNQ